MSVSAGAGQGGEVDGGRGRPSISRRTLLWISGVLTVAVGLVLATLDGWLRTDAAPLGIVSFELAGSATRAQEMVESWGPEGRMAAALIQGIDYLYLVVYSVFLMLAGLSLADRLRSSQPGFAALLRALALLMPLAGALDAVENFALIRLLWGSEHDLWARLAFFAAIPKFAIALGTGLLLVIGGVLALISRGGGELPAR
jgi:hypothetical protein